MEQKVIQVGNSLAVTLPSSFVKAKKIKAGKKVYIDASAAIGLVQVRTSGEKTSGLTPEFFSWLEKFNKKYKNALTELAKK
ncbi:MAG: hypothetical protein HY428_01470 [Candidatus Levybacteria bacterium]|nr:hypothetical protein [Candidatus Levybacteria bacterium]